MRSLPTLVLSCVLSISLLGCPETSPSDDGGLAAIFRPAQAVATFSEATCDAEVSMPLRVTGASSPDSLLFVISYDAAADGSIDAVLASNDVLDGSAPDFTVTDIYPPGTHALLVTVTDDEGQMDSTSVTFDVADDVGPTPICINGLAVELMPVAPPADADGDGDMDAGAMTIWASDFVASPASDCSEPISYSIRRAGEAADVDQTNLILTCDDSGTLLVDVLAWDDAGNSDYCETYVVVQDNLVLCAP
jgi:hypothetical protein